MREAPPLCAQRMAASADLRASEESPDEEDDEFDEELLVDEEVLVDDDEVLRGREGRPPSRRAKKAAARVDVINKRRVFAKSASH